MFSKNSNYCVSENIKDSLKEMNNIINKTLNGIEKTKPKKDINHNGVKKALKSIEVRKEEVLAIRNRFPTKVPIIVQRFSKESYLPQLEKSKFLVPQEITMSQFQTIIRNRMKMTSNQALYLLVNNRSMLSLSLTLAEIYTEHAGSDGFLYVTYASQEVFGTNNIIITNNNNKVESTKNISYKNLTIVKYKTAITSS